MPTISLTVPTDKANKVYDAFKASYGHDVETPTAQEKLDFVKSHIVNFVKETVYAQDIQAHIEAKPARDDEVAS